MDHDLLKEILEKKYGVELSDENELKGWLISVKRVLARLAGLPVSTARRSVTNLSAKRKIA